MSRAPPAHSKSNMFTGSDAFFRRFARLSAKFSVSIHGSPERLSDDVTAGCFHHSRVLKENYGQAVLRIVYIPRRLSICFLPCYLQQFCDSCTFFQAQNLLVNNGSHRQASRPLAPLLPLPARDLQTRRHHWTACVSRALILHNFSLSPQTSSVPPFSVHADELQDSTKRRLNEHGYFYANSNAGLGWTDRANRFVRCLGSSCTHAEFLRREAFYNWRIIPRALVDTNTRDLTSTSPASSSAPSQPIASDVDLHYL